MISNSELFLESLVSTHMSTILVQIHVISHTDYSGPHWKWLCIHPFSSQRDLSHDLVMSPLCGKTSDTIYDLYTQGHIPFLTCHSKPPTIWPQHNFLKSCPTRSHHVSALSPNWTNHMLNKHICFLPSGTLLMLQLGILSSPLITTPHPRSCCCSVTQLPLTLCDPVDCNTPGCPVFHHLPEFAQTHVHESVMPSNHLFHPLSTGFCTSSNVYAAKNNQETESCLALLL